MPDQAARTLGRQGTRILDGKESLPLFLGTKKPADVAGCQEKQEIFEEKSGMNGIL